MSLIFFFKDCNAKGRVFSLFVELSNDRMENILESHTGGLPSSDRIPYIPFGIATVSPNLPRWRTLVPPNTPPAI